MEKSYLVKWEIDVTASSPEEAAKLALDIQRDKDSEALFFSVYRQSDNKETFINLFQVYETKAGQIDYIKNVVKKFGCFTTAEAQADCSPAINVLGDTSILIEGFYSDHCIACHYVHSTCTSEEIILYEELTPEVIQQIFDLIKSWEETQKEEV